MTVPLIAVAVNDDGSLSPHAGRALRWLVYAVENGNVEEVWRINLTAPGCLHEWHVRGDGNRHPLHSVDVALAGSGGDGVIRRLAERGTQLVATAETNPLAAVNAYLSGTLLPGAGHDESQCLDPEHHANVAAKH